LISARYALTRALIHQQFCTSLAAEAHSANGGTQAALLDGDFARVFIALSRTL
jgi:hypothetical protein